LDTGTFLVYGDEPFNPQRFYLGLAQALELHCRIIEQSGGVVGILDRGAFESALTQSRMLLDTR
jgi:hypothetical protein